jgi:hypothetical protein
MTAARRWAYVALTAVLLVASPAQAATRHCRDARGRFTRCPPTPTPTPAPSGSWVAAPIAVGGYAKLLAAEQAVPKDSPYTYSEAIYRTVQAGEVVRLGARVPDVVCACVGQPREWAVSGLDGRFIGYLSEANIAGVAPGP